MRRIGGGGSVAFAADFFFFDVSSFQRFDVMPRCRLFRT